MAEPVVNLLDQSHRREITKAMKRIHLLMPLVDKAERCGVECQEFRATLSYLYGQFDQLLKNFFPQGSAQSE
jgi:hypothetical protein